MNLLLVHGFFLEGNSSDRYVYELAREIKASGRRAIIVSQEHRVLDDSLVDKIYEFDSHNRKKKLLYQSRVPSRGECILIKPQVPGKIPVFTREQYAGAQFQEMETMSSGEIRNYIVSQAAAISNILSEISISLILSNHLLLQPYIVEMARKKSPGIPHYVIIHGNSGSYACMKNSRLSMYGEMALAYADKVIYPSRELLEEITLHYSSVKNLKEKSVYLPPGIDGGCFSYYTQEEKERVFDNFCYRLKNVPYSGRRKQRRALDKARVRRVETIQEYRNLTATEDVWMHHDEDLEENIQAIKQRPGLRILFFGQFLPEKGAALLILLFPFLRKRYPDLQLFVAGYGKDRIFLETLVSGISRKQESLVRDLLKEEIRSNKSERAAYYYQMFLESVLEDPEQNYLYYRNARSMETQVVFTGYLQHTQLGDLLSHMDLSVLPSIGNEGFGTAALESVCAGVPAVIPANSGLHELENRLRQLYGEYPGLTGYQQLLTDDNFLNNLLQNIILLLEFLKTQEKSRGIPLQERLALTAREHYSWSKMLEKLLVLKP